MEKTPLANRLHIGVFGRRNVGKSSLINALTNQELSLVSAIPGTTTDPVYKAMELAPLGPILMMDTAGIDDTGLLGELRVKKTEQVIRKTDLAILVIEANKEITSLEKKLLSKFKKLNIPVVIAVNKIEVKTVNEVYLKDMKNQGFKTLAVSAKTKEGIEKLRQALVELAPKTEKTDLIKDLIKPAELVVLVTPIDSAAPKGRLILPQVQTIRDILDNECIAIITKENKLKETLHSLNKPPQLVVTDSQVFKKVASIVPSEILMTSFSILFARFKGELELYLDGIKCLNNLKANDKILIAEACTHQRQHEDIGTIKIPKLLRKKFTNDLIFEHVSGGQYPENLADYKLILHCGACMLNRKETLSRLQEAKKANVAVINYGMAIAQLHGILERALKPFPEIYKRLNNNLKGEVLC